MSLPCRDKGNYQDYCMVMLMFFKPWRNAETLKEQHDTWIEAFEAYNFSARQKQLMNNFNIRYECLDSRDDFATQRKAGVLTSIDSSYIT